MTIGFDKPLYILPFDHRDSFQTGLFGWKGTPSAAQTAEIAAAKQVVYDGFKAAVAAGVPKEKAGILVDEHTSKRFPSPSAKSWCATTRRATRWLQPSSG